MATSKKISGLTEKDQLSGEEYVELYDPDGATAELKNIRATTEAVRGTAEYIAAKHGIRPGTDCTDRLNDLFALMHDAGYGGDVVLQPGSYVAEGQVVQPMAAGHVSVPIRLRGAGGWAAGRQDVTGAGTVLDLRYLHATNPKLFLPGAAGFTIDDLTLTHSTADGNPSGPMVLVYWASFRAHRSAFYTPLVGTACTVDAVVFGASAVDSPNGYQGLQGYGSELVGNAFQGIRRAAYMRAWANGIFVTRNRIWTKCGGTTPFEVDGPTGDSGVGNVLYRNLVEGTYYTYPGGKVTNGTENHFDNDVFDAPWPTVVACYRAEAGASRNLFRANFVKTNVAQVLLSEATRFSNTLDHYDTAADEPTRRAIPVRFKLANGGPGVELQTQGGGGSQFADGPTHVDATTGAYIRWRGYPNDKLMYLVWSPDGTAPSEKTLAQFDIGGSSRQVIQANNLSGVAAGIIKGGTFWSDQSYTVLSASDVAGPTGYSFALVVRDTTNGGSAIVFFEANQTPVIVAQAGATTFVTGSPGATEIKVIGGSVGVAFRAGSSRNNAVVTTVILTPHGA